MSSLVHSIASADELREAVLDAGSILVVGRRTKESLSQVDETTQLVSTSGLTGVIEYEPSEFVFTARAGTTIAEISATLAAKNQYLPFDPLFTEDGASIGGTLAAGLSGPGRHRFGGVRDFVLGVQFVAGDGQLIRAGGKVVKNAAGFDLPKLMVGSCGRLGALTELTFKVFPRPVSFHNYEIECESDEEACNVMALVGLKRWEADAIDYVRTADRKRVWIRLAGDATIAEEIAKDIRQAFSEHRVRKVDETIADTLTGQMVFDQSEHAYFVKVPTRLKTLESIADWVDRHRPAALHASSAGGVCWVALPPGKLAEFASFLTKVGRSGLVIKGDVGDVGSCLIGSIDDLHRPTTRAIKRAMDPTSRFPGWSLGESLSGSA